MKHKKNNNNKHSKKNKHSNISEAEETSEVESETDYTKSTSLEKLAKKLGVKPQSEILNKIACYCEDKYLPQKDKKKVEKILASQKEKEGGGKPVQKERGKCIYEGEDIPINCTEYPEPPAKKSKLNNGDHNLKGTSSMWKY